MSGRHRRQRLEPMTARQELHHLLEQQARCWPANRALHYRGPTDFVLAHGADQQPTGIVLGMAPRACYGNALIMADQHGWTYMEGYALVDDGIVQHAWAVDRDGTAWELTWPIVGRAYRGVAFHPGRVDDATWNGDATVLDDWQRRWPLLQQPWTGEDWQRQWPPTDGMIVLRAAAALTGGFDLADAGR